jgi:putative effector of murein hydrolase
VTGFAEGFSALAQGPMLAVGLTLAAFVVGQAVFVRLGKPVWLPAVLVSAVFLSLAIVALPLDYPVYHEGAAWLIALLGPATVALGVPLFQQIHHIRRMLWPILITLPVGAMLAVFYTLVIAWALGATPEVLASLAPKSVTAPIAIGITEELGGSISLMMGSLLLTGVVATIGVDMLAPKLKITDERILGFALGLNGHAIGTVRAFEISATSGAFASLGMSLTGLFTALLLPLVFPF